MGSGPSMTLLHGFPSSSYDWAKIADALAARHSLLDPGQGPQISAAMNEELFAAALEPTWAEGFDGAADASDIWASVAHGTDIPVLHRTIAYMTDREENAERWTGALEETDVPLSFVWGMQDP